MSLANIQQQEDKKKKKHKVAILEQNLPLNCALTKKSNFFCYTDPVQGVQN